MQTEQMPVAASMFSSNGTVLSVVAFSVILFLFLRFANSNYEVLLVLSLLVATLTYFSPALVQCPFSHFRQSAKPFVGTKITNNIMLDKLEAIRNNFINLEEQMSDPEIVGDQARFTKVSKEYFKLKEVVDVFVEYKKVLENLEGAKELLREKDDELREMAKLELQELEPRRTELEEQLKTLLIPRDPEDSKDVIFEIRAGTGGDEASLFAGDLYRMYSKYFESQGWKTEPLYENEGTVGGYKEVSVEVRGTDVYGKIKFESGVHRVQRVPDTETKGRVHTSAATVAVMPKMEMEDVNINRSDLKIDTFRSSGAGGQHVNKTESGVRLTHIPTGVVVECTEGRSQHSNKEIAEQRLYQKIYEMQKEKMESSIAAQRKSLVGSGDRSEKIRTYNFPQNRITDHRIDLTLYNLDQVMEGEIGKIIEGLQIAENAEKMKAMQEE
jgi:peptide chain release factor 1